MHHLCGTHSMHRLCETHGIDGISTAEAKSLLWMVCFELHVPAVSFGLQKLDHLCYTILGSKTFDDADCSQYIIQISILQEKLSLSHYDVTKSLFVSAAEDLGFQSFNLTKSLQPVGGKWILGL